MIGGRASYHVPLHALMLGVTVATASMAVIWTRDAEAQCRYDVTIIQGPKDPVFGIPPTKTLGINDLGHVVGHYANIDPVAFVWNTVDGVVPLGIPGALFSEAHDLNASGWVVGEFDQVGDSVGCLAFVWANNSLIEIPPPAGSFSEARAINNNGTVVGTTSDDTSFFKAFVWSEGRMTLLEPILGPRSSGWDITSDGQVVGWMGTAQFIDAHPFRWENGTMVDLGLLPGAFSSIARAINDACDVVGRSWIPDGNGGFVIHATRWSDGEILDLGTLPKYERSGALDINGGGQIVGSCSTPSIGLQTAFLWQNGLMCDLNELVDPTAGVLVTFAHAINETGQIAGTGSLTLNGQRVGVLLTPIAQPLGDLDADCTVGIIDFLMLLSLWGPCPAPCPPTCTGDLDDDCTVGITDFLILLTNWG